jgi:hypothetical protein
MSGGREADRAGADHGHRQLAVRHERRSLNASKDFNVCGAYQLSSI